MNEQQETDRIRVGDLVRESSVFPGEPRLVVRADYVLSGRVTWLDPFNLGCFGSHPISGVYRLHACSDEENARWLDFWRQVARGATDLLGGSSASGCFAMEAPATEAPELKQKRGTTSDTADLYAQNARLEERGKELLGDNRSLFDENKRLRSELERIRNGIDAIMRTIQGRTAP